MFVFHAAAHAYSALLPISFNAQRWLSICYVVGSFVLVYLYAKWVPHYVAWVVSKEQKRVQPCSKKASGRRHAKTGRTTEV